MKRFVSESSKMSVSTKSDSGGSMPTSRPLTVRSQAMTRPRPARLSIVVRRLAATLGETQRKVFMMATFGECDNDEIVRATGLSEANVRQLLSRARKRIKELYQSYER